MRIMCYTICLACHKPAIIVDEVRYSGMRGMCLECNGNWPES